MITTKNLLKKHDPCDKGYVRLCCELGPGWDGDKPIPLSRIVETNGLDDALWALRAVPEEQEAERDRLARLFACWCVRNTPLGDGRAPWDLLTDRSRRAVEVAELYVRGEATDEELFAAAGAAKDEYWEKYWEAPNSADWDASWAAAMAANRAAKRTVSVDSSCAANNAAFCSAEAANSATAGAAMSAQTKQFLEMFQDNEN